MSYQTWHNYGYGICTDVLETADVMRIKALIHCAPMYERQVETLLRERDITDASADDYLELGINGCYGIASLMADVIAEAEQLNLMACNNYDGTNYLLYIPSYPWHLTAQECSLTEEKLRQIIEKYAGMLSDEAVEVGYEAVENGG